MGGKESNVVQRAGLIGMVIALLAGLLFLAVTSLWGGYPAVARYGGAVWVSLLTWIITMPVLAPWLKRKQLG
ncbi:MAG: hypothetical protein QN189_11315 [Armatimonadota bacterium]|nr:hypothetical protein [Armatimonadota bacterium]